MTCNDDKLRDLVRQIRDLLQRVDATPIEVAELAEAALHEAMQGLHLLPREIGELKTEIDSLIAEARERADTTAS